MQGFFVHVSNGAYPVSGVLGMTNSVRTNDLNPTFKAATVDPRTILRFALNFDGNKSLSDAFVLYFDPLSTINFDGEKDALKLMNTDLSVPNLYSLTPDIRQLSINGMPSPVDSLTRIPLGVQILKDGWVNFTAKDISRIPSDMNLYLLDKEKNITQDLKTNPSYRLFLKAGENNQRLELLFVKAETQTPSTYSIHSEKLFVISNSDGNVKVKINLPDYQPGKLYVSNMLGQIILEKEVTNLQMVDISSGVRSGVYVVTMTSGERSQSEKTLIRKE
jgi:fibronectin-binding autotransporter adhesin